MTVKDSKMLITGKIRCIACPTVLINLKVSSFREIRDKLQFLIHTKLFR
jgi:hypothetical protein